MAGESFVECIPEWHTDPSCLRFHTKNIIRDGIRASGMYAFVHLATLSINYKYAIKK